MKHDFTNMILKNNQSKAIATIRWKWSSQSKSEPVKSKGLDDNFGGW